MFLPLALFDAAGFFQWFVENANYWFVFIFMVIESSFIPFPSEVVVPPAAYLASTRGDLNAWMVVLVATAGAIVGALINYYLSLWIGRPLVYKFADSRFGHACLIDRAKVDKAEKYFDKHGAASTFIGRLIPAVRQLISIPAGLSPDSERWSGTPFSACLAGICRQSYLSTSCMPPSKNTTVI